MSKSFRVAVLGPKGQCGQCVVDELLSQGHSVVGISRSPPSTWSKPGEYSGIACDFGDIQGLSTIFSEGGFDAVVSAFAPPLVDLKDVYRLGVEGYGNIKMAIVRSTYRVPVIIIGGAGSLYYTNGVQLCDDEGFAFKHCLQVVTLSMWEGVKEQWSLLSPPWQLRDKGIQTGKYEVFVDDYAGSAEPAINNGIYNEDMAVAIVDEVKNKKLAYKHWTCTGPVGLKEW